MMKRTQIREKKEDEQEKPQTGILWYASSPLLETEMKRY
jgi:hypothetical protein